MMSRRCQCISCILVSVFSVLNLSTLFNLMFFSYRRMNPVSFEKKQCMYTVISLATFGSRIFKIGPTIQSLTKQTMLADLIVVNVALESRVGRVSEKSLFDYISSAFGPCVLSNHRKDYIHCLDNTLLFLIGPDYGPATKVLGTVKGLHSLDADTCIVSVDDDVVYDSRMVEVLVSIAPSDGALGFSCEEIPFGLEFVRHFDPSLLWWEIIDKKNVIRFLYDEVVMCNGWLHGYQGILYRKSFFTDDVFSMNSTMPGGCFYADDVRLAGYLWAKGIKRYVYPHFLTDGKDNLYHRENNESDSLNMIDNSMMEKQWPCVQYFGWY